MAKKVDLCVENLADLSAGTAGAVINAAIKAALRDTEDRGSDKKARKVTIELEMKKLGDAVAVSVKAKTGLPPYQTEPTIGSLEMDGLQPKMRFNPDSPGNPDQPALPLAGRAD